MNTHVSFPLIRIFILCIAAMYHGLNAQTAQPSTTSEAPDSPEEEIVIMPEFEVSAEQDTFYRANSAVTSNRFNTPLIDIPQSITVLTEAFLRDFEFNDINEALVYVPGVANDAAGAGDDASIQVRGQPLPERLIDGMPDQTPNFRPDPATFERVEIIKGSSSSLYGSSWPGGVVNSITKKPKAKPTYQFITQFGSFNLFRQVADFTGPITKNKKLLYRLVGVYEVSDSFRDCVNSDRKMIMPALTYIFRPGTQLAVNFDYLRTRQTADHGLPIFTGDTKVTLPPERFLNLPDQDFDIIRRAARLMFDHRFNKNWSLRVGYTYTDIDSSKASGQAYGAANPTTRRQNRRISIQTIENNIHVARADLLGSFRIGPVMNQILIGMDYKNTDNDLITSVYNITPNYVDLDNPKYDYELTGVSSVLTHVTTLADEWGFYMQERATVLDGKLQVIIGFRYDTLTQTSTNLAEPEPFSITPPHVISPRYAILYRPIRALTFYATYGESYRPDVSGKPMWGTNERLKPAVGALYEVGAKTRFWDGKASVDVEVFDLERENIVNSDPDHAGFAVQSGRERSRGFAVSFNIDPFRGFTMFGGYAYNESKVIASADFPQRVGRPLRGNPKNSFTLFAKYRILDGPLKRLGFGLGVRYVDKRAGTPDTTLVVPGYTVMDAQINYSWKNYRFNIAIKNLFDDFYWANVGSFGGLNRAGVPLSYRASLSCTF